MERILVWPNLRDYLIFNSTNSPQRDFLVRIPKLSTDWKDIGVRDRPGWHGENLGPPDETRSTSTPENTH